MAGPADQTSDELIEDAQMARNFKTMPLLDCTVALALAVDVRLSKIRQQPRTRRPTDWLDLQGPLVCPAPTQIR